MALAASAGRFGAEAALGAFGFMVDAFAGRLAAFYAVLLPVPLATYFADFFAAFFAVFLVFTPRFFVAAALPARVLTARFAALLAFFFFADFLATTKSSEIG